MNDAVRRFMVEAERIVSSFATSLESYRPQPTIYHYTNDVGLKGILESGPQLGAWIRPQLYTQRNVSRSMVRY